MLDRYQAGIEILSVRLLYVHPPDAVHDAFRDVASAQEDKLRTINLANVFAVEKINQAKGEAAAMTEAAAAFKEQRIAAATSDANAFALRLDAYRRAPELTKFRLQIETLEDVLPGVRKFVRPGHRRREGHRHVAPAAAHERGTGRLDDERRRRPRMTQTGRSHMNVLLRRSLPALAVAGGICALASSFFTVDVTEYGLVTRFGRVVRVISEPGLYVTAPFDRVVRLDKRVLFSRPARSEYLTIDKKNLVVESLATWRIADPEHFLALVHEPSGSRAAARRRHSGGDRLRHRALSGVRAHLRRSSGEPVPADRLRDRASVSRILPEPPTALTSSASTSAVCRCRSRTGTHVFDRMKAERAKIAKENRSAGELQARKITAEADHERVRIEAEAAGAAERIRAEGDAEASRTYAAAFGQDPKFYEFLRTLQAYDKILDDKTTLFLSAGRAKSCGCYISMRNRRPASRRRMRPHPSAPSARRRSPAHSRPMPIGS